MQRIVLVALTIIFGLASPVARAVPGSVPYASGATSVRHCQESNCGCQCRDGPACLKVCSCSVLGSAFLAQDSSGAPSKASVHEIVPIGAAVSFSSRPGLTGLHPPR